MDPKYTQLTYVANQQAAVLDGVRHGQDPRPDVPLQQVNDRLRVGYLLCATPPRLASFTAIPERFKTVN